MVGLYHKRRAERSQSKVLSCMIRAGAAAGAFTVVGFTLVAIFFNGTAIKGPLGSYLSKQTGLDVTIEDAEFSPVYPDVIKLNNVKFGSSTVGELYLEYDISSALSDDELKINDIYINDLKLSKEDLAALSSSKAGYKSIRANAVRFHHTPINTRFLKTKDATIRLNQVSFSDKEGLTFRSGSLASEKLSLFKEQAKSFVVDFEQAPDGMRLNNFSVQMYGGIISGKGMYNQSIANANSANANQDQKADGTNGTPQVITDIKLDELSLANVIIYSGLTSPENITLTSQSTVLTDVILSDDAPSARKSKPHSSKNTNNLAAAKAAEDAQNAADKGGKQGAKQSHTPKADDVNLSTYIVQGINGNIEDLKITSNGMQGTFNGSADEISMPNLQTTMESNEVSATFSKDAFTFKLQGNVYEGRYLAQGELDHKNKELNLEKLLMKKAKLAINTPRLKFLSAGLNEYTFNLKHAGFESLEFLSYLNSLPMSIQSITGTADNLSIKGQAQQKDQDEFYRLLSSVSVLKDNVFANTEAKKDSQDSADADKTAVDNKAATADAVAKSANAAAMELEFKNFLYSDLLISSMHSKWHLDADKLLIEVPNAKFKESSAAAEALIALKAFDKSHLKLNAPDFESADLNSNLVSHMLTGRMDVNLSLESKAQAKTFESLINEAKGKLNVNSDAMLISDFGLDLINGGKDKNYELSYTELLTGVQGAVAGISALKSTTTFNQGVAQNTTSMALSTANMRLSVNADYERNKISGNSFFISPAKDSSTKVTILGDLDEPRFAIIPLRRGEQRPGLYLPQYDENAKAKEQTDAAAVLNGKVKIEEPQKSDDDKDKIQETSPDPKANSAADSSSLSDKSSSTDKKEELKPQEDKSNEATSRQDNSDESSNSSNDSTAEDDKSAQLIDQAAKDKSKDEKPGDNSAPKTDSAQEPKATQDSNATKSDTQDEGNTSSAKVSADGSESSDKAPDKETETSTDRDFEATDSQASDKDQDSSVIAKDSSAKDTPDSTQDASSLSGVPTENLSTSPAQTSSDSDQKSTKTNTAVINSTQTSAQANDADSTTASQDKEETSADAANAQAQDTKPQSDAETIATEPSEDSAKAETVATVPGEDTAKKEPVTSEPSKDSAKAETTSEASEVAKDEAQSNKSEAVAASDNSAGGDEPKQTANKSNEAISAEARAQADKTETDLLKNVLIDSFFDSEEGEEELIF
ncbi:hypothetical protein [uncultured Anaerobiospirillum sp.]|uniref:hypothetical protein n=1 Tax=uncultured Anaerobiospirillum sp. TaxID=265728 RepID=UPI0028044373|nr:hypothetical protein [uncultured Anaerobiospirillum sp.]